MVVIPQPGLCGNLSVRSEVEIIDVLREPERALDDGIFMTSTLVRVGPLPVVRIVGTRSQTEVVLRVLGLDRNAA